MTKEQSGDTGATTKEPGFRRNRRFCLIVGAVVLVAFAGYAWRPAYLRATTWRVRTLLESRNDQQALDVLNGAANLISDNAELHFLLARTYRRLGRMDDVRTHIEQAWNLGWPVEQLEREQWLALAQTGQMREADPHLTELLVAPNGDGREICEAYVNGYSLTFDFERANMLLNVWQADFPDDPQPHFFRGLVMESRHNFRGAVDEFSKALSIDPRRTDIRLKRAGSLVRLDEFKKALEDYTRSLNEAADDPNAHVGAGNCLMEEGRNSEALSHFNKALALDSGNINAMHGMGELHLAAGEYEEATRWLREAMTLAPADPNIQYALGSALQGMGDIEAAQSHFRFSSEATEALTRRTNLVERVQEKPDDVDLRFELGVISMRYVSPEEGQKWLLSVLNLDPLHREAHEHLADFYREHGNDDRAAEHRRIAAGLTERESDE